jgi:ABC-type amino acid transport substrate-binding protein
LKKRRTFIGSGLLGALALSPIRAAGQAAAPRVAATRARPLVWPLAARPPAGVRSFSGHANTVLDIVGRIGAPANLAIFTEGNHLMALLGEDILGAFPQWAKAHPHYADVELGNVVVLTLPQPIVVQTLRSGAIALGNLTLEVSRKSGLYPDIVMAGPAPLRELRKQGVLEPQARYFSKNRGPALLVRKGNPLGIRGIADVARKRARFAQADAAVEMGARTANRAAIEELIGKEAAAALLAQEVERFPGRLGIMHRDLPEMLARDYADVALTQYHLVSYWARTFPDLFELVPIAGAERFTVKIAFGRVVDPLRARARAAFEEFFFGRAREVYPRYDFARMADDEYAAPLALE